MVHCLLCGTPYAETDAYCPGERCGTDLHGQRSGDPECAVQAWCEPRRITATPGETVMVTLTLRNAGTAPDRYDPEIPRDVGRRIGLDRPGPPDVYPGEERTWTIVYTVPHDLGDAGVGGMFGLGDVGVDSGGSAFEDVSHVVEESDVAVRVVSVRDMRVAACAPFSVHVVSTDHDADGDRGTTRAGVPLDPYDDDRRGGRGRAKVVGAVLATVAAIVVAVLIGMAMAGSDDKAPAAKTTPEQTSRPSGTSSATAGPTDEAPVTSTPDASVSASPETSAPSRLTVPDVTGMTEARGVALLRERGFRPTVSGTGGTIAATDPAPGKKVDRAEADIRVTLAGAPSTSAAPQRIAVPPVVGRSTSEAQSRLAEAGLRAVVTEVDSTEESGTVVGSSPTAGRLVAPGSAVTLAVSRGPSAPPTTEVPDLTRMTLDAARARVKEAGLTLVADDEQSPCPIATQTPGAGKRITPGGVVSVTVTRCG